MTNQLLNRLLTIFILSAFIAVSAQSQEHETVRPEMFYLGIQPSINAEPYDEYRNNIDINILPLIAEISVNSHWSIRLSPVINLQFRPEFPAALSHIGAALTVPYHFSKKNSEEGHRGFYIGPNLAISDHMLAGFLSTTFAAEAGYAFLFNRILSVTVGGQAGRTFEFSPDSGELRVVTHTGAIFSFGFWF